MSRSSLIEQLTIQRKSALEFEYDKLWAPPIMSLFTPQDIQELIRIATSIRYNGNINKKYELIDAIMKRRGFRKAHSGTNRVVYNFLENPSFVAKVAVDKVGMKDSPAEYINQRYFQPFCCKILEVDPSGVIAFVERVNPISSIEEFISIADDVFNMMVTKIIGKYVVDDLGTNTYMNFGVRQNSNGYTFGPVIIDFPYVYELDGAKLKCQTPLLNSFTGMMEPCGGDIDYDAGFNHLICTKCGREYKAMDLAKETKDVKFEYDSKDEEFIKQFKYRIRARIVDNGKIITDSGRSTNKYLSKEEFEAMNTNSNIPVGEMEVGKVIRRKKQSTNETRNKYTALQKQYYEELAKRDPTEVQRKKPIYVEEVVDQNYEVPVEQTRARGNIQSAGVIDVAETLDRFGNTIATYNSDITAELERVTFPEIHPNNEYELSAIEELRDGKPTKEVTEGFLDQRRAYKESLHNQGTTTVQEDESLESKLRKSYEETVGIAPDNDVSAEKRVTVKPINNSTDRPTVVYTDEEVKAMAQDVARQLGDSSNEVAVESSILDAEADRDPTGNPIIRPYANAKKSVSAEAMFKSNYSPNLKESVADTTDSTIVDDTSSEQQEIVVNWGVNYEDDEEDDDGYPKKRKRNKKNKKNRNRFNNNHIDEY